MAITKPTRNMLSTGVSDSSDSTFLTADSSENATFAGNLIVTGNLTVSGTQTVVSSTVETHADPLIELNTGAGSNSNDLGFVFERGSTGDNACLIWDESADVFTVGTTTATGTSTGNMSTTPAGFTAAAIIGTTGTFSGALAGTLSTAAQTNITSLGTLTALTGGTGDLIWDTDTLVVDSSADRVGIGTTSPDGPLHVQSATAGSVAADAEADELVLENSSNTGLSILIPGDGLGSILFGNPGTNGQKDGAIRYYGETHATTANRRNMVFTTGNSERLRIGSSGQIGIGGANYGTDGQILTSTGTGTAPAWEDAAEGGISTGKAIAMAMVFG